MAVLKGIDVSKAQGYLSQSAWNQIKLGDGENKPSIDFAIIKAT